MSLDEGLSRDDIYPYYTRGLNALKPHDPRGPVGIKGTNTRIRPVYYYDLASGLYRIDPDSFIAKFSPYQIEAIKVLLSLRTNKQSTNLNLTTVADTGSILCFTLRDLDND